MAKPSTIEQKKDLKIIEIVLLHVFMCVNFGEPPMWSF